MTDAPEHAQALLDADDDWYELLAEARGEAAKAMRKFPQPNYVISKIAEEAGEVVKAAIHCAEGRETADNLRNEIRQTIAMLYRLWIEGDEVHGLPPVRTALSTFQEAGIKEHVELVKAREWWINCYSRKDGGFRFLHPTKAMADNAVYTSEKGCVRGIRLECVHVREVSEEMADTTEEHRLAVALAYRVEAHKLRANSPDLACATTLNDEDLLAQINAFDPYDVEFARRFRAYVAELARKDQAIEALEVSRDMLAHNWAETSAEITNLQTDVRTYQDRVKDMTAQIEAADKLAEAGGAMIDFHNGPAETKRPDIWQRLLQRFATALTAYQETGK